MENKPKEQTQILVSPSTRQEFSVEFLISKALENSSPVETMERLLAMRKELKSEWAKEQYVAAMAKFQAACPIIKRDSIVKDKQGKERYKFAKLDKIVSEARSAISENGFSYKFEEIKDEKFSTVICVVTHICGHTEKSDFKVEIGSEEYMTNTQKYGARTTFAKRYAFCNAFGITTGDEDNDAGDDGEDEQVVEAELQKNKNLLLSAKSVEELAKFWIGIPPKYKGLLFKFKEELKKKYESPKV